MLLTLSLALGSAVCSTMAWSQAGVPEVITIKLSLSNVHVIRGSRSVLIDAGGKDDLPALEAALTAHGIGWIDLAAVIVTHGHSDHAALAAEIRRRSGAAVLLGSGDLPMAAAGHNDNLRPTNFTARVLKQFFIDPAYQAFAPDLVIDGDIDLRRFGIAGVVRQMPGHTPGSLVVLLDDGRAFVGDMVLGGWMGGAVFADRAGEHYFQADLARNRANIVELLRGPTQTFYLGHGGPVTRASVLQGFGLDDPLATRTSRLESARR
jgi:glyoxylase-like metal-dependent hydrolase (beta-lactamase superfamily II)